MSNPFLESLRERRAEAQSMIDGTLTRAATEKRDLTETEATIVRENEAVIADVDPKIEHYATLEISAAKQRELLREVDSMSASEVKRTAGTVEMRESAKSVLDVYETPGDFLVDYIAREYRKDADAAARIQRAVDNLAAAQLTGVLPEPIEGQVINTFDGRRPIVTALGVRPMGGIPGTVFERPKVSQNTAQGTQSAWGNELATDDLRVVPVQFTKVTKGGVVGIPFQAGDWTQPSVINAVLDDMARQYARQTEDYVAGVLAAAAVAEVEVPTTDAKGYLSAFYEASADVYTGCGELADTVFASVDMWATLGSLVDGDERPFFPSLAPMNAGGVQNAASFAGNPLGLRLVVSPELAAGTLIVGNSNFLEVYEQQGGFLREVKVANLVTEIAWYGYIAAAATVAGAFVSVVDES
jgi:hypothetical protein